MEIYLPDRERGGEILPLPVVVPFIVYSSTVQVRYAKLVDKGDSTVEVDPGLATSTGKRVC